MSMYAALFKALNEAGVQYVVVGGLATVLHGYARFTADIDLVINLETEEAEKAIQALDALGMKSRLPVDPMGFADESVRETWINDKNMLVFSMYDPTNPLMVIDLFVREPVPFDELLGKAVIMELDEQQVPVCDIEMLIALKIKAGRQKDLDDVKFLKEILDEQRKH